MDAAKTNPGPDAERAFRLGLMGSAVAALAVLALAYRYGYLSLFSVLFTLVILFPVYLLVVASVLSVWLGFDRDIANLRPVYRDR